MSALQSSAPAGSVLACVLPDSYEGPLAPAQAEVFLRFSPRIALRARAPWAVLLDLRGIRDSRLLESKIAVALERLGLHGRSTGALRFGRGRHPADALLRAVIVPQAGAQAPPTSAPLTATSIEWMLDPFGLGLHDTASKAQSIATRWIPQLHALGIRTQADFARLPFEALGSRFGKSGVELARRLSAARTAAAPDLWPVFVPPQKLIEETHFAPDEEVPAAHEPLLFVSRPLLDRLCLRLKARGLRATQLKLTLEIQHKTCETTLTLWQPQGSTAGLLPLFQEHLRQWIARQPHADTRIDTTVVEITAPPNVSRIALEVSETTPGTSAQRDLFDHIDELTEHWDSLIGRLQQRLGPESTFFALATRQHLPEQGWKPAKPEALPATSAASTVTAAPNPADAPTRPSRLLKRTVPLRLIATSSSSLILKWPLKWPKKTLRVRSVEGPERLTPPVTLATPPAVPTPPPLTRLYYRVLSHEGPMLWVYTHSEAPFEQLTELLLQGYFD